MKENIILTDNSGIFSCQMMEYLSKGEPCTIILNDFWLNDVHQSRLSTEWGQRKNEFPLFVQNKISLLYPDFPTDKRLTFGMFKEVRASIIKDLQAQQNVKVIFGNVHTVEKEGDSISFKDKAGQVMHTAHQDAIVYNSLIQCRENKSCQRKDGTDLQSQTRLYSFEKGHAPKQMVVFGLGLSGIWIKEQCPESRIKFIVSATAARPVLPDRNKNTRIPDEDILRFSDVVPFVIESLPLEDKNKAIKLLQDEGIETDKLSDFVAVFRVENGERKEILFVGEAFNSVGYVPKNIKVPDVNVINIHTQMNQSYSPKNLPMGALLDRYTHQVSERTKDVPLDLKVLTIQFESLFFRHSDESVLQEYALKNGVVLDKPFFDQLRKKIPELEDAPETPEESLDIMVKIFSETCDPSNSSKTADFKNVLYDLLSQKRNLFTQALQQKSTDTNQASPLLFGFKQYKAPSTPLKEKGNLAVDEPNQSIPVVTPVVTGAKPQKPSQ